MKEKNIILLLAVAFCLTFITASVLIIQKNAETEALHQHVKLQQQMFPYVSKSTVGNTSYTHIIVNNTVLFSSTNSSEALDWVMHYCGRYLRYDQKWGWHFQK